MNIPLISALFAISLAQALKFILVCIKNKKWANIRVAFSTGGMPSSHSAGASSLVTSLILNYGIRSPYVAIACVFGLIVIYDSMGVRRQSGEQGLMLKYLLNRIDEQSKKLASLGVTPNDNKVDKKVEDLIISRYKGHDPSEVLAGIVLGALVSLLSHSLF